MTFHRPFITSLFSLGFVVACSAATEAPPAPGEGEVPGSRISQEALKGGCHVVCPKCHPNEICPMIACQIECPNGGTPCGSNVCKSGEYCCNSSCGTCAPMGAMCTQQVCGSTTCVETAMCIQGYVWDSTACQCVPQ